MSFKVLSCVLSEEALFIVKLYDRKRVEEVGTCIKVT